MVYPVGCQFFEKSFYEPIVSAVIDLLHLENGVHVHQHTVWSEDKCLLLSLLC